MKLPMTAKAPSTLTDQSSALAAPSIASANEVQVLIACPADQLTAAQVCDLPMGELLAQVNGRLDTTGIDEPGFFGYVTITRSGHITIHTPASLGDDTRDAAIRFLITQHLGLPAHNFPDVFQVTRFTIPGEAQA